MDKTHTKTKKSFWDFFRRGRKSKKQQDEEENIEPLSNHSSFLSVSDYTSSCFDYIEEFVSSPSEEEDTSSKRQQEEQDDTEPGTSSDHVTPEPEELSKQTHSESSQKPIEDTIDEDTVDSDTSSLTSEDLDELWNFSSDESISSISSYESDEESPFSSEDIDEFLSVSSDTSIDSEELEDILSLSSDDSEDSTSSFEPEEERQREAPKFNWRKPWKSFKAKVFHRFPLAKGMVWWCILTGALALTFIGVIAFFLVAFL
ncbi:hypothetical protein WMY93_022315 [Mugilogobius chulae]|uniref:Uncharacterized protein n=1 Tax=Mugilogobius chulae TaxID=88201 RepID=A0AAW0N9M5_9GOBI